MRKRKRSNINLLRVMRQTERERQSEKSNESSISLALIFPPKTFRLPRGGFHSKPRACSASRRRDESFTKSPRVHTSRGGGV